MAGSITEIDNDLREVSAREIRAAIEQREVQQTKYFSLEELLKLVAFIEDVIPLSNESVFSAEQHGLCATVMNVFGRTLIFTGIPIDFGGYSAVELVYDYTSKKSLVLIRLLQPSDQRPASFSLTDRSKIVDRFNSIAQIQEAHFNNSIGLVNIVGIISLTGLISPPFDQELGIVQPAYEGNLHYFILSKHWKNLNRNDIIHIFQQALKGLDTLHERDYVHRDIKLPNLLYSKKQPYTGDDRFTVVIADFGMAVHKEANPSKFPIHCNRRNWAPEVWELSSIATFDDNKRADVWAMGIALYSVLRGEEPYWIKQYASQTKQKESRQTIENSLRYFGDQGSLQGTFSKYKNWYRLLPIKDPLWHIVSRMLDPKSQTRITAREAAAAAQSVRIDRRAAWSHDPSDSKERKSSVTLTYPSTTAVETIDDTLLSTDIDGSDGNLSRPGDPSGISLSMGQRCGSESNCRVNARNLSLAQASLQ